MKDSRGVLPKYSKSTSDFGTTCRVEGWRKGPVWRAQEHCSWGSGILKEAFQWVLGKNRGPTSAEPWMCFREDTGAGQEVRGCLLTWLWDQQHQGASTPPALPQLLICPGTRHLGKVYPPPVRPWLSFKQNKLYLNTCLEIKCKTVFPCQDPSSELSISSAAVNDIITTLWHSAKSEESHPALHRNRKQPSRNFA